MRRVRETHGLDTRTWVQPREGTSETLDFLDETWSRSKLCGAWSHSHCRVWSPRRSGGSVRVSVLRGLPASRRSDTRHAVVGEIESRSVLRHGLQLTRWERPFTAASEGLESLGTGRTTSMRSPAGQNASWARDPTELAEGIRAAFGHPSQAAVPLLRRITSRLRDAFGQSPRRKT